MHQLLGGQKISSGLNRVARSSAKESPIPRKNKENATELARANPFQSDSSYFIAPYLRPPVIGGITKIKTERTESNSERKVPNIASFEIWLANVQKGAALNSLILFQASQ